MKEQTRELIELLARARCSLSAKDPQIDPQELRRSIAEYYREFRRLRAGYPGVLRQTLRWIRDQGLL